jgi:hypothetical protein
MEATLIKRLDNGWPIYSLRRADGKMIATTRFPFDEPALMIAKNAGIELQKLSHVKCDEIFGKYIPSELSKVLTEGERGAFEFGYCLAREHNKDKVFSLEQIVDCWNTALKFQENGVTLGEFMQSLKPKEIEVEVEMDAVPADRAPNGLDTFPKLDSDGCLILKKKEV